MSRRSHWLTASLFLALVLILTAVSDAAPVSLPAPAFLGTPAGEAPCRAQIDAPAVPGVSQPVAPIDLVIYPDCGFNCSDSLCSGATTGDTCYDGLGQQGTCTAHSTTCSGESHRSPCTCDNLCVPSGGTDDTLYRTNCCSGQAVPGSTWCDNPADWGTTWESCHQICA